MAYNGGWTSVFYLVNTGNASAQFTLNFFDENGIALPVPLSLPQSGTTTTTSALTRTLAAGEMLVVEHPGAGRFGGGGRLGATDDHRQYRRV